MQHVNQLGIIKLESVVFHSIKDPPRLFIWVPEQMMEYPPGLVYLCNRLHFFLLPIAIYLGINVGKQYLGLSTPTWIMVVTALLARPALTLILNRYTDLTDRRAATALGAALPPHVKESSFTVVKKILASLEGFPGLPSSTKFIWITYLFNCIWRGSHGWVVKKLWIYFQYFSIHKSYGESNGELFCVLSLMSPKWSGRYLWPRFNKGNPSGLILKIVFTHVRRSLQPNSNRSKKVYSSLFLSKRASWKLTNDEGPQFRDQFESLLGTGVFNADGMCL